MLRVDRHVSPDDLGKALRLDVHEGLTAEPKMLPPKWFYDERGSDLFERITRLPEYYPTRAERALLHTHAADIAAATGAESLIELGAGSGEKTRLLLDALNSAGTLRRYVPVDVSGEFLEAAAGRIAEEHPGVEVHAVVADFERHLHLLPTGRRRLVAFLGSTLGNLPPGPRRTFLGALREVLTPSDTLLLGLDLVKDPERLRAAYDDAQGVTAEFNRNLLWVLNEELSATFVPDEFAHVAVWDPKAEWVEMRLRAVRAQGVWIGALDMGVDFAAGEEIRTEISAKFRREPVSAELQAAGFTLEHWWSDPGDFAVLLARPTG